MNIQLRDIDTPSSREEAAELLPTQPNAVTLIANRDAEFQTADVLLTATLRMRPDRIILGEVRGKGLLAGVELVKNRETVEEPRRQNDRGGEGNVGAHENQEQRERLEKQQELQKQKEKIAEMQTQIEKDFPANAPQKKTTSEPEGNPELKAGSSGWIPIIITPGSG